MSKVENGANWFNEYINRTGKQTISKWIHYFDIFSRELERFRLEPISFLEIGVWEGGSIPMWREYFANGSKLIFIDINPECKKYEESGIIVEIGNQADAEFMRKLSEKHGPFDVVVDDGSHVNFHQIASFSYLWPHIRDHGIYIVEDCHTSYWPGFGGGFRNEASYVEFAKRLIDRNNSWYTDQDWIFPFDPIAKEIFGVRFYDSVVVTEKLLKKDPPTMFSASNGEVRLTQEPLKMRGRVSRFRSMDGS